MKTIDGNRRVEQKTFEWHITSC